MPITKVNLIKQLKQSNPDLKEIEIEGVLHIIANSDSLTSAELIRQTGIPKETLRNLKSSLAKYLADPKGDEIALNKEAETLFKDVDFKMYSWSLVRAGNNKLAEKIKQIRDSETFQVKREFDQFLATPETTAAKAQIVMEKIGIEGKRIALLGDDDLVCIALSLYAEKPLTITVFDIDKELLSLIEALKHEMGIENIQTVDYDLKKDPENMSAGQYTGQFDAVLMDPPYTRPGVALFLSRGIWLLNRDMGFNGGYIFLNYGNSYKSPEKTLKIQQTINDSGLVIEDKIDKFNRYSGGESIGSASSLYILKTTPATTASVTYMDGRIYTYENIKEENFPFVEHLVFKLYDVPGRIINSKKMLQKIAGDVCTAHKLKVMGTDITKFKPFGYSITVILANSNLLIHTWPEYNSVHIDLVTCSPIYNKDKLPDTLSELFKTDILEVKQVE